MTCTLCGFANRFRVKGVREPISVYQLRGVGRLRTRLERSRARGCSRFVGRSDEMAMLEAALDRVVSGQGQVIGVVASPVHRTRSLRSRRLGGER